MAARLRIRVRATRPHTYRRGDRDGGDFTLVILAGTRGWVGGANDDGTVMVTWDAVVAAESLDEADDLPPRVFDQWIEEAVSVDRVEAVYP